MTRALIPYEPVIPYLILNYFIILQLAYPLKLMFIFIWLKCLKLAMIALHIATEVIRSVYYLPAIIISHSLYQACPSHLKRSHLGSLWTISPVVS